MPPSPVFNWLAVAHSALVILDHALQHRAKQVARVGGIRVSQCQNRTGGLNGGEKGGKVVEELVPPTDESPLEPTYVQPSSLLHANEAWLRQIEIAATPLASLLETFIKQQVRETTETSETLQPNSTSTVLPTTAGANLHEAADSLVLTADINPSRLGIPSSQDLQLPASEPPPHDVVINSPFNLLRYLKPICCRCSNLGLNSYATFSLPKFLLLA
jgi:hypothetical protein